ncbi:MAG: hypothetical protein LBT16_10800 [Treponema sp.]|jgi:hypothetical protein|nr:hypothetical protein [Treponema sp.]
MRPLDLHGNVQGGTSSLGLYVLGLGSSPSPFRERAGRGFVAQNFKFENLRRRNSKVKIVNGFYKIKTAKQFLSGMDAAAMKAIKDGLKPKKPRSV